MRDELVTEVQRLYPQIYIACHVDHVRSASTQWKLSSRDSSILSRLDCLQTGDGGGESRWSDAEMRLTAKGSEAMSETSVLDFERVKTALTHLNQAERKQVVRGLGLLARAARNLK